MTVQEIVEIFGADQPRRGVMRQVAPLAAVAQPIDHDRLVAARHQGRMEIRADEAGAAGDHDHEVSV